MADEAPKVEVEHLSKVFGPAPKTALERLAQDSSKDVILEETGHVVAVADVSFTVGSGEIFVVMGLSGSGKSTLIRCINRLIDPTAGRVLVDGEDVTAADRERLRRIRLTRMAMVFQHFALFPHKTVAENVEYGLKIQNVPAETRREKALRALDLVGLRAWADSPPDTLSGGMQQRVGLARALAVDAEILLMDEPFSALDPLIRRDMQDELLALQQDIGMSIIFITHDLHEALILGDRIAIMKDGRFVQVGTPEEIVGAPADPYVAAFTQDVDRGRVFTAATVMAAPEALVAGRDSVQTARERMRTLGRDALFLVDGQGRPQGVVCEADLLRAEVAGADLRGLAREDFPSARREQPLAELYEACRAGLPLAVLDNAARLSGVVEPRAVFAALAGGPKPSRDAAAPAASVAAES